MVNREKEQLVKRIICDDASVAAELERCASVDTFREVFAKRNIDLSEDEALEFFSNALSAAEETGALDTVSGGISWAQAKRAFLIGAQLGIGTCMVYDYYKYGNATRTYNIKQLSTGEFWK